MTAAHRKNPSCNEAGERLGEVVLGFVQCLAHPGLAEADGGHVVSGEPTLGVNVENDSLGQPEGWD